MTVSSDIQMNLFIFKINYARDLCQCDPLPDNLDLYEQLNFFKIALPNVSTVLESAWEDALRPTSWLLERSKL